MPLNSLSPSSPSTGPESAQASSEPKQPGWEVKAENTWHQIVAHLRGQMVGAPGFGVVIEGGVVRKSVGSHWEGQLSTSALSTATAISALVQVREHGNVPPHQQQTVAEAIQTGCAWLAGHQNKDGGFGDTDRSHSNIATSLLVLAAWEMAGFKTNASSQFESASAYVDRLGKWDGLKRRYGKDKTFAVPILSNCALAGMVPWSRVSTLPFEAAWLPQKWYRLARMPVVSYAVPALVAIGQARFHFAPPINPFVRWLRSQAREPTLAVLRRMQPSSGGYLEAVPLTSFVLMSLAAVGNGHLPVAQEALRFILESRLADGSWPIDTNLATWVTSLSLCALGRPKSHLSVRLGSDSGTAINSNEKATVESTDSHATVSAATVRWLLSCQHKQRHPFTGADPGGWGWTNLSGAVPDADDTPAALLALSQLDLEEEQFARLREEVFVAVGLGLRWLVRLQNRDGGWPTFCKGWGKLPFDRSGTDLTAHAIRAIEAWRPRLEELKKASRLSVPSDRQLSSAVRRGFRYLAKHQRPDGSWLPLWFGNQDEAGEENPIYGTGKVLLAYVATNSTTSLQAVAGQNFLRTSQNVDGGWGGGASTGYAVKASDEWTLPNELERSQSLESRSEIPLSQPSRGKPEKSSISEKPSISETHSKIEKHSTIEETAIALEALAGMAPGSVTDGSATTFERDSSPNAQPEPALCASTHVVDRTIMRGLDWLSSAVDAGNLEHASPIGFYFAKLWYYERLYPTVFALGAVGAVLRRIRETDIRQSG